jgi:hypothetical protein
VAKLSPDGTEPVWEPGRATEDQQLQQDFEGTIFEAALDAKDGRPWLRSSPVGGADRYWGNQRRQLDDAARLLGVAKDLSGAQRDEIAQVLSVEALVLHEEAAGLKTVPGYRRLGAAILTVLSKLQRRASRALRLLFAGHIAGRWGMPLQWDPARRCLGSLPFLMPGTGPPP